MTARIYPVAETAAEALHGARGFAAREREAEAAAGAAVRFRVEPVGPAFADPEAALAVYAEGAPGGAALAGGWGRLTPVSADEAARGRSAAPVRPAYADGRRWPPAPATEPLRWRLWVSYWRIEAPGAETAPLKAARRLRKSAEGQDLGGVALSALARQPLRPVKPQQPLEIGLFEARRPEAPDLIIPDE